MEHIRKYNACGKYLSAHQCLGEQEAKEGQYRSTAIRQQINLQTAPPLVAMFLTNQHGLKESDRGSPKDISSKLFENWPDTFVGEDF